MEAPEQHVTGSHSSSSTGESPSTHPSVAKRKRTKRQRAPSSPPPPPPQPRPPAAASSSTSSASAATEEEEDMAHCLILLAQGRSPPPPAEKFTSRRFTEAAATAGGGKAGFYVYECKTCSKCFPSFQALGGHRASHKKPKMTSVLPTAAYADEKIAADAHREPTVAFAAPPPAGSPTSGRLPPPAAAAAARVHECSICGAEFSSGQALGGHMRRHRPIGAAPTLPPQLAEPPPSPSQEVNKERNLLSLDLNLPAPADDNSPPPPPPPAFPFADKRPMVFSALVDCHY